MDANTTNSLTLTLPNASAGPMTAPATLPYIPIRQGYFEYHGHYALVYNGFYRECSFERLLSKTTELENSTVDGEPWAEAQLVLWGIENARTPLPSGLAPWRKGAVHRLKCALKDENNTWLPSGAGNRFSDQLGNTYKDLKSDLLNVKADLHSFNGTRKRMFESVDQTQQAELDPDQFLDKYFSPALEAARPVNSCGSRPPRIFRRFASPREKALKEAVQRRNDLGLSILINRHMIVVNLTRDNAGALALAHEHLVERGVCPEERANLSPVTFLEHLERHPEQLPLVLDQRLDERACGPLLMLTSAKGGRPQYNLTVKLIRASLAVDPEEAAADHERHVDSGINMIIGQNEESVRVVYQRLDRSLHRDLASWNRCFAESRNKFGNERGMLVSRGTKILGLRDLKGTYLVKCERLGPDDWFRGRMVLDIQAQAPQSCGVYASFRFGDLEGLMVLTMSVDLLQLEWNAIKTVMMEEESGSELIDYWGDGGRKKNRVYCRFVGRNRETGALLLGKENIGFLDFNPATMEAKGSLIVPLGLHDDDEQRDEMRRQWRNRRTHFSAYKTSHDPSQPLSPDQWDEFGKQAYLKREVWKSSVKASDCNGIWPVDSGLRIQPGSGGVFHPSNAVFQPGNTGMLQLGSTISGLPLPPSPNGPLPGPTSHYAGMHTYQLPYYGLPNYPPLPYAKQSAQLQQSDDDHGNPVGSWEKASRNTR